MAGRRSKPKKEDMETLGASPAVSDPSSFDSVKYEIARGKSITSRRGTLRAGASVSAKDFGGDANLQALISAGYIVTS